MAVRLVAVGLLALLGLVQAQLWFGRGSIPNVQNLARDLSLQRQHNEQAAQANARLAAEIHDLQEGLEMVEERARQELGMVKPDEIFVQIARQP